MTRVQSFTFPLLIVLLLYPIEFGFACSGYKITIGNRTFFGSNEDAWRVTPHIWFETRTANYKYGAAFTGSRFDGNNGYAPQSGMNEMGLVFERLAAYTPENKLNPNANRQKITNTTLFLKDIIHSCATVEDVQAYISKYDHSIFLEDVFMYTDKSGKYLIVEPYTMTTGNEPTRVISNFCPSITSEKEALQLERYRNGVEFLKTKVDTTLAFCATLSDAMHVCRGKIGDGTLLTSIWDLNKGTINLYFYHNYKKTVQFNLTEELKKGNHIVAIETLFPPNSEFEKLRNYKTPKNNIIIGIFMVASAGLFLFTSLFFLIKYFRRKLETKYAYIQLLLFPIGLILCFYMFILCGSINVFYFPSPYKDPADNIISLTSYIPFGLLPILFPFYLINYRLFKEKNWSIIAKGLFTLNNLVYTILIWLFVYWGFYNVFS